MNLEEKSKEEEGVIISDIPENPKNWENDSWVNSSAESYKVMVSKTNFEITSERIKKQINSNLEVGVTYTGIIDEVYLASSLYYQTIKIVCRIDLESGPTYATQKYSFGGDYDEYYLEQIFHMLNSIEGAYLEDFAFTNTSALVDSMQKIVGSRVEVEVIENTEDKKKYKLTLLGKYDRLTDKVI